MRKTFRSLTAGITFTLGLAPCAAAAEAVGLARVRSSSPSIVALIEQASEWSQTFRGLVETVNASDGIVYVEEGHCGHGVHACLVRVTVAGPNRLLWVRVDTRKAAWDIMGAIGHELRHTTEVLSNPTVRSDAGMYYFYAFGAAGRSHGTQNAVETEAAIEAGTAVRAEARQHGPHPEAH